MERPEKMLIFGGSGYIGSYIAKASIGLGHPTYIYSRPNSTKQNLLERFQSIGATVIQGELDEQEKLVQVLRNVDIVISALAYPQVLDQLKIIEAIKLAGNIKRFLPSDFGVEEDKVADDVLLPFQVFLEKKKTIRRAIEAAGIPYTFVSANCFGAYFVNLLLHPHEQLDSVTIFGSGEAKFVLNYEDDIALYTVKVATDPRACNRIVIYRPMTNITTQLELLSLWEKKTGKSFKKIHVSEEDLVALSGKLPQPENIKISIAHSVFAKGVTMNFDVGENDVEASRLYPDVMVTTVDDLLDIFISNPPKPALAAFE